MTHLFIRLTATLILVFPACVLAQVSVEERIQYLSEQLLLGSEVTVAGVTLASAHIIPELYSRRQFSPAWIDENRVDEFIQLVGQAKDEGLDPADYAHAELLALISQYRSDHTNATLRADVDLLLTESFSRYGHHLFFGKVDPASLDENWNWKRVKAMLAEYRALGEKGGWPQIAAGPTLKPGMTDDRIPVIRKRLAVTGDLAESADNGSREFDTALQDGVENFQDRHNLDQDGAIGPRTLAAMNATVEERIDQIRVNLERIRWIARFVEDEFVMTNIASFKTYLVRDREVVWSGRSQVGKDYRQTPVFHGKIKYLQFNPTWTVPPGILAKDILPRVQQDPGYLATKNMDLVDRDGSRVDPTSVDWSQYSARRLPPYQFVQRPGPTNALGRVKFIFPNEHFVFLHDTPSKALFSRTERSFSSGCIRVENPFELAEMVLNDTDKWNPGTIQKLLDSEKPQTVFLKEQMTVMLLYSTVGVLDETLVRFYNDIYERDARVLRSLNEDFKFRLPEKSAVDR